MGTLNKLAVQRQALLNTQLRLHARFYLAQLRRFGKLNKQSLGKRVVQMTAPISKRRTNIKAFQVGSNAAQEASARYQRNRPGVDATSKR